MLDILSEPPVYGINFQTISFWIGEWLCTSSLVKQQDSWVGIDAELSF